MTATSPGASTTPVIVSAQLLTELGACDRYLRTFAALFPESSYPRGVEVTAALCAEHALEFDWDWAAEELLNDDGCDRFYDVINADADVLRSQRASAQAYDDYVLQVRDWRARYATEAQRDGAEARRERRDLYDGYYAYRHASFDAYQRVAARTFAELTGTHARDLGDQLDARDHG